MQLKKVLLDREEKQRASCSAFSWQNRGRGKVISLNWTNQMNKRNEGLWERSCRKMKKDRERVSWEEEVWIERRGAFDVVILYLNNNNTTRNSTSHCRTVSILRVSIHRECIGCVYQALIKLILIYPLENDIFVILPFKLTPEIKC